MNTKRYELDDADLHAWVDGRLDGQARAAVEAALAADPDLAARARAYIDQNHDIRALYDGIASEPLPDRLRPARIAAMQRRRRWLVPVAASILWLAVGLTGGWLAHDRLADFGVGGATRAMAAEAISAYRVYAVEKLHPVEVGVSDADHLMKWLSRRVGYAMTAPDLSPLGFGLVGGRLLPAADGEAAAQLMYEDASGRRVTLYVSRNDSGQETAFRYQEAKGVGAFIWLEPDFGFAIAGDLPRQPLLEVSKIVYEAFEPTH